MCCCEFDAECARLEEFLSDRMRECGFSEDDISHVHICAKIKGDACGGLTIVGYKTREEADTLLERMRLHGLLVRALN